MSKVILFGAGRGADVAYRFLSRDTDHEIHGFTVDEQHIQAKTFRGLSLVPFEEVETHYSPEEYKMLILLGYQGMNRLREEKYNAAKTKGYQFISYIASNVFRIEEIDVGENCFILDNQSISLDVKIGNNVVMWSSNHIGDMTTIADHAWMSSHVTLAANVQIGERSFLGIGATVSNNVVIARDSFIGADVLLSANTNPNSVLVQGADDALELDSASFMRIMMARGML